MKKILITGATGLLGRPTFKVFSSVEDWQVVGTAFRRSKPGLERVDLSCPPAIPAFLDRIAPVAIIHTAAERRPDVSERDPHGTQRLNVEATAVLAEWARKHHAFLLYLSSDYVFDGTCPPYFPDSPTCPVNAYGLSKLEGEQAILASGAEAAILRVPILYGNVESLEESSITAIARNLLDARGHHEDVLMDHWATRYPTLTDDVARVLCQMLERRLASGDFSGIYHWSGDEPMTKYEMACRIAPMIGFEPSRLIPDRTPARVGAPRPKDCHLDTARLEQVGIGQRTPFLTAIAKIVKDFG